MYYLSGQKISGVFYKGEVDRFFFLYPPAYARLMSHPTKNAHSSENPCKKQKYSKNSWIFHTIFE